MIDWFMRQWCKANCVSRIKIDYWFQRQTACTQSKTQTKTKTNRMYTVKDKDKDKPHVHSQRGKATCASPTVDPPHRGSGRSCPWCGISPAIVISIIFYKWHHIVWNIWNIYWTFVTNLIKAFKSTFWLNLHLHNARSSHPCMKNVLKQMHVNAQICTNDQIKRLSTKHLIVFTCVVGM